MQKFWSRLAVELGKRAGLVAVVGLLITLTMGYGVTKLTFATGTDSYLNASDPAYRESIRYQHRFGGEANLTVITMNKGHKVLELITDPANRSAIESTSASIRCQNPRPPSSNAVHAVSSSPSARSPAPSRIGRT